MIITRRAAPEDIDRFKTVVVQSVLELCRGHYTQAELKSLLAQYPGRELYEKWIRERVLVVAEDEGAIVGLAVHVLPSHVKRHVGKRLVELIEDIARNQGAERITLGSSLNAVGFYAKCGYVKKEGSTFMCNDGVELGIVNFEKALRN